MCVRLFFYNCYGRENVTEQQKQEMRVLLRLALEHAYGAEAKKNGIAKFDSVDITRVFWTTNRLEVPCTKHDLEVLYASMEGDENLEVADIANAVQHIGTGNRAAGMKSTNLGAFSSGFSSSSSGSRKNEFLSTTNSPVATIADHRIAVRQLLNLMLDRFGPAESILANLAPTFIGLTTKVLSNVGEDHPKWRELIMGKPGGSPVKEERLHTY